MGLAECEPRAATHTRGSCRKGCLKSVKCHLIPGCRDPPLSAHEKLPPSLKTRPKQRTQSALLMFLAGHESPHFRVRFSRAVMRQRIRGSACKIRRRELIRQFGVMTPNCLRRLYVVTVVLQHCSTLVSKNCHRAELRRSCRKSGQSFFSVMVGCAALVCPARQQGVRSSLSTFYKPAGELGGAAAPP